MLSLIDRYFEEAVCSLCLGLMASCVMLQVILRYFFAAASPWAEEIAVYSMVFAVYLGASMAVRDRAHIRIVMLVKVLPRPLDVAAVVLADLLWFAFLVFMIWQTIVYTQLLFAVTYISPGLGIEQKWFQLVVPCAITLTAFRMLQVYWRWRGDGWKGLPL